MSLLKNAGSGVTFAAGLLTKSRNGLKKEYEENSPPKLKRDGILDRCSNEFVSLRSASGAGKP